MRHADALDANRAAFWDVVICLLTVVTTLTLWNKSGDNPLVLIANAFGSGLGTWLIVLNHRIQKDLHDEYIRSLNSDPD